MIDIVITQVANGLTLGFIYVLVAIGLSIIFGQLGLVNFAHGAFLALSAYIGLTFFNRFGWIGVPFAPLVVAFIGMAVERLLLSRAYGKEPLFGLILTFAIALLVEAVIRTVWGSASQPFPSPEILSGIVEYGPVLLTRYRIAVIAATVLVLFALWGFLRFTRYGRILRAGARDPEMIGLLGINSRRVFTGVFGLGTFLAGVAGIFAAPLWSVTPNMSEGALMPAFVTVTIGGLGSYAGAVVAGLLVGVVTALTVQFWPEASAASMYVLMIIVLLARPRGLFGERWERFE
jgi:branched-chain amino acid transport system permease protein